MEKRKEDKGEVKRRTAPNKELGSPDTADLQLLSLVLRQWL